MDKASFARYPLDTHNVITMNERIRDMYVAKKHIKPTNTRRKEARVVVLSSVDSVLSQFKARQTDG